MYLHDAAHSSFNRSEYRISIDNAGSLAPVWTVSLKQAIAAAPTVVDGVIYFGDWSGNFYAISAGDGKIRWQQNVGKSADPPDPWCMAATGVSSQAALVGDTVYVGGGDAAVYALDKASGAIVWRVPLAAADSRAYVWSSIMVYGKSLYLGLASLDDCPLVQGAVVRVDLASPNRPAVRYLSSVDDPGSGVWSTPAIDSADGTVFINTGTGTQDPASGQWGEAFLSLDGSTLETKSYFLLPTYTPGLDIEWGSSPSLISLTDGTRLAVATGKDGILYALNRDDLSVAWTKRLAVGCVCPECGCGSLSTPAFDGSVVYVGAGAPDPDGFANGSVYAIDPSTGETLWMQALPDVVIAPVTVANGVVFVASTGGAIAFNAQTGERLWDDGGYGIMYSQPVVVNGVLYTNYVNGDVVAWGVTDSPSMAARKPRVQSRPRR